MARRQSTLIHGQGVVEYASLVAVVALIGIVAMSALQTPIRAIELCAIRHLGGNAPCSDAVGGSAGDHIASLPIGQQGAEYAVGGNPLGIAADSGTIYVAANGSSAVGKLATNGVYDSILLSFAPTDVQVDPDDGSVWAIGAFKIARIDPIAETAREFSLPCNVPVAGFGLAFGPDHAWWVACNSNNSIAKVSPQTGAVLARYPVGSMPFGVTAGRDGRIWITENGAGKLASMDPTSGAVLSEVQLNLLSSPASLVQAGDGRFLVVETGRPFVAAVTPAGVITEYPYPSGISSCQGIAAAPDGSVYLTCGSNGVVRFTTSGAATRFTLSSASSYITAGPGQSMWITESSGNVIQLGTGS